MAECKFCFSEIAEDNPVLTAEKIENAAVNWSWPAVKGRIGQSLNIAGVGMAEIVAFKGYEGPPGYSEYELPQGTEFTAYVVLKVGDHFFRKDGYGDSYNEITWAGPVRPVKAKEKTVTVYEF